MGNTKIKAHEKLVKAHSFKYTLGMEEVKAKSGEAYSISLSVVRNVVGISIILLSNDFEQWKHVFLEVAREGKFSVLVGWPGW